MESRNVRVVLPTKLTASVSHPDTVISKATLLTQQVKVKFIYIYIYISNKPTRCSWAVTFITALLDYSTCFG